MALRNLLTAPKETVKIDIFAFPRGWLIFPLNLALTPFNRSCFGSLKNVKYTNGVTNKYNCYTNLEFSYGEFGDMYECRNKS